MQTDTSTPTTTKAATASVKSPGAEHADRSRRAAARAKLDDALPLGLDPRVIRGAFCTAAMRPRAERLTGAKAMDRAALALRDAAILCRSARWSGTDHKAALRGFFYAPELDFPVVELLLMVDVLAGLCDVRDGYKSVDELKQRLDAGAVPMLVPVIRHVAAYAHIPPRTEAELAMQGYTVAEDLIDLLCAYFIARVEAIQKYMARLDMPDVERAARVALQTAQQARKIIADGVAYTLREN